MSKLVPTIVTEETIGDVVFSGQRSRPVVARMQDGSTVVCCRSTARRHGWVVEAKAYAKPKAPKAPKAEQRKAPKAPKAEQRKADLAAVEELLATPKKPSILAQINAEVAAAPKLVMSLSTGKISVKK